MAGSKRLGVLALVVGGLAGPSVAQEWITQLEPGDLAELDHFGGALASSQASLIVGTRHHDFSPMVTNSGAAYVHVESAGSFQEQAKLSPFDPSSNGKFGHAVALEGNTALVGAPDAQFLGTFTGGAYLFERIAGVWSAGQRINAPNPLVGDRFGWSVALNGDWAAVGAYGDDGGGFNAGAVFLFRRSDEGLWQAFGELRASDSTANDFFGRAVAIDGDRMIVGAPGEDTQALNAGAVYVFEFDGVSWVESAKQTVPDAVAQANAAEALDLDGDRIAVSVPHDDTMGNLPGYVHMFELRQGEWLSTACVASIETGHGDEFGASLDLRGNSLLVGAPRFDGQQTNGGSAWLFQRVGEGWLQVRSFVAPQVNVNEGSGSAVALSDGRIFVAGHQDSETVQLGGSVQVWSTQSLPEHSSFCFGVSCPCGNDDAPNGCWNSTGRGARLSASGSLSAGNANLQLSVEGLVPGRAAVLLRGTQAQAAMFGDGLRCVGGSVALLAPPRDATADGTLVLGAIGFNENMLPLLGSVTYFQAWYRDIVTSPCSGAFNFSNALGLEFTP